MSIFADSPELVFLCGFLLFYILMHWVEGKTKLCSNSDIFKELFGDSEFLDGVSERQSSDEQTIKELKERVANLEKIVTDSRYELDQKINRL